MSCLYGLSGRQLRISGKSESLPSTKENLQYNNPQAADVKGTRRNINKDQQSHTSVQPCTDAGAGAAVLADESISKDQAAL